MMKSAKRGCLLVALLAVAVGLPGCGVAVRQAKNAVDFSRHEGKFGRYGRLTDQETQWAKVAWRYFENNTNPESGLVNAFDQYPTFSMWQVGDYLAALVAVHDLDLIDTLEFDRRMSQILQFLNTMDLSEKSLPGRLYNSVTGKMVNASNKPEDTGWSGVEIGRLLTWMKIIGLRYPQYREYLDKAVLRWNFCQVIDDAGTMYRVSRSGEKRQRTQEGRLGYEQLAGAGFAAWGFDTERLWRVARMESVTILGVPITYDARDPRLTGEQAPVSTMPWVLLGMEYGWRYPGESRSGVLINIDARQLAEQVYQVQEVRFERQGELTARTDYQLREPPLTIHDAVFVAGYPWNTVTADGDSAEERALVSTRAVFGMWGLWPGSYTDRLMQAVQNLFNPERGWYEGRLEQSGAAQASISLSTNAMVLETLLFKVRGQLFPHDTGIGYFQHKLDNVFERRVQCLPPDRPISSAEVARGS